MLSTSSSEEKAYSCKRDSHLGVKIFKILPWGWQVKRWLHLLGWLYRSFPQRGLQRLKYRVLQARGEIPPFAELNDIHKIAWSSAHILSTFWLNKNFPNITEVFRASCRTLDAKIIWILKNSPLQFPNPPHPLKKSCKRSVSTRTWCLSGASLSQHSSWQRGDAHLDPVSWAHSPWVSQPHHPPLILAEDYSLEKGFPAVNARTCESGF